MEGEPAQKKKRLKKLKTLGKEGDKPLKRKAAAGVRACMCVYSFLTCSREERGRRLHPMIPDPPTHPTTTDHQHTRTLMARTRRC